MNNIILLGERYDSIAQAAEIHGISDATLRIRIKKYGTNDSRLFSKNYVNFNDEIRLNGVLYDSITQAAEMHNIRTNTLSTRIKKYGTDSDKLFKPKNSFFVGNKGFSSTQEALQFLHIDEDELNRRIKLYGINSSKILHTHIKLCGKYYYSLNEAAKKHNMNWQLLKSRIDKLGTDDINIFKPHLTEITLNGITYKSLTEASELNNIQYETLVARVRLYGTNSELLFKKPRAVNRKLRTQIVLNGKKYKSIADAARKHNLKYVTLYRRIKIYGTNSDELFKEVER